MKRYHQRKRPKLYRYGSGPRYLDSTRIITHKKIGGWILVVLGEYEYSRLPCCWIKPFDSYLAHVNSESVPLHRGDLKHTELNRVHRLIILAYTMGHLHLVNLCYLQANLQSWMNNIPFVSNMSRIFFVMFLNNPYSGILFVRHENWMNRPYIQRTQFTIEETNQSYRRSVSLTGEGC